MEIFKRWAGPALYTRLQIRKTKLKFVNADCDLTKIYANCKFDTPFCSFQVILNKHTFSVVSEQMLGKKRKPNRTGRHGQDSVIQKYFPIMNRLTTHVQR
jgi:hypothetical protein